MGKLISAGFFRLFHSLCFKIYIIFSALYSLINILNQFFMIGKIGISVTAVSDALSMDTIAFNCAMTMIFASAVFIGMFIGREYSDGTMRNKLVAGHSRGSVYLSNFIVCLCAHIMGLVTALTITLGLGVPLIGTKLTAAEILSFILLTITASTAVISVFLFISMLLSSKAAAVSVLIIGAFAMLIFTVFVDSRLNEREYIIDFQTVTTEGENGIETEFVPGEEIKNPYYPTGTERKIYEFLDEFMPTSQLYRTANANSSDLTKSVIYDIIVLIAVTEAGVLLFHRKDIR